MAAPDERSLLRRLDDRVVPVLQHGARRAAGRLSWPFRALSRWEHGLADGVPVRFVDRHRQALVLLTAVIAFAGSYVHLQRYPQLRQGGAAPAPRNDPGPVATSTGRTLAGGAVIVGPEVGIPVGAYVDERLGELAAATGTRVAVVSFTDYRTAEEALDAVDGLEVHVAQVRVPAEGEEPFSVALGSDPVAAVSDAVDRERERIASEEREIATLVESGTVEEEEFLAFYVNELERLAATRNLLASGAGVVFALVVEGSADELADLVDEPSVRLVDVAPGEVDVEGSTFYGLLPEDREETSFGSLG